MVTIVFDDKWPFRRPGNDDEDRRITHFDVGSHEVNFLGVWLDQTEMDGTDILQVNWCRPTLSSVPALWIDHETYHCTFSPDNANVNSFVSSDFMKCSGVRSPGSRTPRSLGVEPCSRYDIASVVSLRIINRGASVMTLVSLYLPSPSDQDNPICISSLSREFEGMTRRVSAAGASKPTA